MKLVYSYSIFFPTPQELKKYGVTTVVRVCEATYDTAPVEKEGIQVLVSSLETEFKTNTYPLSLFLQIKIFDTSLLTL